MDLSSKKCLKTDVNGKDGKLFARDEAHSFTEQSWKEDLVLVAEGKNLYVTKAVLAHASPVFDKMFQGDFKETKLSKLELPGKKLGDVRAFLLCIYPNSADISPANVYSVLPLADEYQVAHLKSKCETCLLEIAKRSESSDDLYKVLHLANLYNMPTILQKCIKLASEKTVDALHKAEKKMPITLEIRGKILEKMAIRLQHKDCLEVLNKYHKSGLKKENRLDIRDFSNWDGKSLDFTVSLNSWHVFKVNLLDISVECKLKLGKVTYFGESAMSLKMQIVSAEDRGSTFRFVGKIVVKPISAETEEIRQKFDLKLSKSSVPGEVTWPDMHNLGSSSGGYMYHEQFDVEMHILAEKRK